MPISYAHGASMVLLCNSEKMGCLSLIEIRLNIMLQHV